MWTATPSWELSFKGRSLDVLGALIEVLPRVLPTRRWFGGKARHITSAQIIDRMVIPLDEMQTVLLLIEVGYRDTGRETYVLAIAAAFGQSARRIVEDMPRAVVAALSASDTQGQGDGILYDAMWNPDVVHSLLRYIGDGSQASGDRGILRASPAIFSNSAKPAWTTWAGPCVFIRVG